MIPLPKKYAEQIARQALPKAKQIAPKDTGKGANAMTAKGEEGKVSIEFPSPYDYMFYQEVGTKSFVMHQLAGKTIPIKTPNGVIFRKATAANIGRRRITSRDPQGRIVSTKLTWWHPGLKPKRFATSSLQNEVNIWARSQTPLSMIQVLKDSQVSTQINEIFKAR